MSLRGETGRWGGGRITGGIALRNGEPSVKSARFTLPLPLLSVQSQCLPVLWAFISSHRRGNTSCLMSLQLCTVCLFVYHLHPDYMEVMFAPQAPIKPDTWNPQHIHPELFLQCGCCSVWTLCKWEWNLMIPDLCLLPVVHPQFTGYELCVISCKRNTMQGFNCSLLPQYLHMSNAKFFEGLNSSAQFM